MASPPSSPDVLQPDLSTLSRHHLSACSGLSSALLEFDSAASEIECAKADHQTFGPGTSNSPGSLSTKPTAKTLYFPRCSRRQCDYLHPSHEGQRRFKCIFCSRAFTRYGYLIQHLRKIHPYSPFNDRHYVQKRGQRSALPAEHCAVPLRAHSHGSPAPDQVQGTAPPPVQATKLDRRGVNALMRHLVIEIAAILGAANLRKSLMPEDASKTAQVVHEVDLVFKTATAPAALAKLSSDASTSGLDASLSSISKEEMDKVDGFDILDEHDDTKRACSCIPHECHARYSTGDPPKDSIVAEIVATILKKLAILFLSRPTSTKPNSSRKKPADSQKTDASAKRKSKALARSRPSGGGEDKGGGEDTEDEFPNNPGAARIDPGKPLFACPIAKRHPEIRCSRRSACTIMGFSRFCDVKQHVVGRSENGEFQCGVHVDPETGKFEARVRTQADPSTLFDDLGGRTSEQKWREVYRRLFPGATIENHLLDESYSKLQDMLVQFRQHIEAMELQNTERDHQLHELKRRNSLYHAAMEFQDTERDHLRQALERQSRLNQLLILYWLPPNSANNPAEGLPPSASSAFGNFQHNGTLQQHGVLNRPQAQDLPLSVPQQAMVAFLPRQIPTMLGHLREPVPQQSLQPQGSEWEEAFLPPNPTHQSDHYPQETLSNGAQLGVTPGPVVPQQSLQPRQSGWEEAFLPPNPPHQSGHFPQETLSNGAQLGVTPGPVLNQELWRELASTLNNSQFGGTQSYFTLQQPFNFPSQSPASPSTDVNQGDSVSSLGDAYSWGTSPSANRNIRQFGRD